MLTDEDIKKLEKSFSTKKDLKGSATKDDLKRFANQAFETFATKEALDSAVEKLLTKDEFRDFRDETFTRLDRILGEILDMREESTGKPKGSTI